MNILKIILWNSESCLSSIENVYILLGSWSVGFTLQDTSRLLWVVVSMSVPFLKPLQSYLDLSQMCATQWPVWDMGRGLDLSVLNWTTVGRLFRSDSCVCRVEWTQEFINLQRSLIQAPPPPWPICYILVYCAFLFQSSRQKSRVLILPVLLHTFHSYTFILAKR